MPLTARKKPDPRLPDPPQSLGEHLRVRRHERGLLQREVAAELGVTTWNYLNWERDRTRPAVRFLPTIYDWLGYCPVDAVGPARLGLRLARWRGGKGLSQEDLASLLGSIQARSVAWSIALARHRDGC